VINSNDIYLVVLAVEVDPTMSDPGDWHWPTLVDSPFPVDVVESIKTDDRKSVAENLRRLADRWDAV
jgi:hypothetical protein